MYNHIHYTQYVHTHIAMHIIMRSRVASNFDWVYLCSSLAVANQNHG